MIDKGIAVIYQELMLVEHFTVAENIFLGRQPRNKLKMIDYRKMRTDALEVLKRLDLDLSPDIEVSRLSVANRQMVEIAKAMSRNAKIVVLDEPTAVLAESELEGLFNLVRELSAEGITFIYISHRLKEIFDLCSTLTILKDGKVVESGKVEDYTHDLLVSKMVGRDIGDMYPARTGRVYGEEILKIAGLSRGKVIKNVSFSLRRGEILGISGLAGAGRTETLRALIGADPVDSGRIELYGKKIRFKSPKDGINRERARPLTGGILNCASKPMPVED